MYIYVFVGWAREIRITSSWFLVPRFRGKSHVFALTRAREPWRERERMGEGWKAERELRC